MNIFYKVIVWSVYDVEMELLYYTIFDAYPRKAQTIKILYI